MGAWAWWDAAQRTVTCVACHAPENGAERAGASAQRRYDQLRARRDMQVRARHPRLGGLILALGAEPSSATAWAKGAEGERIVASRLDQVEGVLTLHDRRIPGGRANIDHIAVGPAGVYVIDAKHYRGQVARRDVGGFFRRDERLLVGRRDCTKLVDAMACQVEAVRLALGNSDVAVHPAVCFVNAEWPLFARPFALAQRRGTQRTCLSVWARLSRSSSSSSLSTFFAEPDPDANTGVAVREGRPGEHTGGGRGDAGARRAQIARRTRNADRQGRGRELLA